MPIIATIVAAFFPRLVMVILVITSDYIGRAYQTTLWPLLGFFLLPYTTLAYALAINSHGSVDGVYLLLVALAVLFDLGVVSLTGKKRKKR